MKKYVEDKIESYSISSNVDAFFAQIEARIAAAGVPRDTISIEVSYKYSYGDSVETYLSLIMNERRQTLNDRSAKNGSVVWKSGSEQPMNASKLSSKIDPHSALAEKLYGEVTPTGRAKAKEINYMRAYSAGEIAVGRKAGQFPVTDFTALELRVLALFS